VNISKLELSGKSLACSPSSLAVSPLANTGETNASIDRRLLYTRINSGVTGPNLKKYLHNVERVIAIQSSRVGVEIVQSVAECQCDK